MKNKDPALWAACRIHRILGQVHLRLKTNSVPSLSHLVSEQQSLERCWRMLNKAQARSWPHTADILRRRLSSQIASVHEASRTIHPARLADIPAMTDILSEIRHLEDEFDQVEIFPKENYISVTTDEITLEDVDLGAFTIQLHMARLGQRRDVSAFMIEAEDPNPPSSNSECTHPHVQHEALCAGDATTPISLALAEGRIGDAFQLINRVLHTYNSGSAYVSLEDWDGRSCSDCGEMMSSDSLNSCDSCDGDFCDGCMSFCDRCEQSMCRTCLERNDDGDQLCPKCKELDDKEREEADEEEQTPVSDDPIHDPSEDKPQPPTETIHEYSHSNSPQAQPQGVELQGGPPNGDDHAVTLAVSPAQAA